MKRLLAFLMLTVAAYAQSTTTVTGTVKDLTNSVVTTGQVTFDLKPGLDTTISGAARFSPSTVVCTINGSGLIKALDGVSACVVTQNTSLTPAGTYYKVCLQPNSITPGSCFNWYALSASFDITTAVPTPGTMPAFTFVDLNSNQVITGIKTHTGIPVFSAGISGTAGQTLALPSSADTLVGRATNDTLSNKTLASPTSTGTDSGAETLQNKTLTGVSNGNTVQLLNMQPLGGNVTGNSADITVYTYTIPANTFRIGTVTKARCYFFHTGAASVSYKYWLGATSATLVGTTTSSGYVDLDILWTAGSQLVNTSIVSNSGSAVIANAVGIDPTISNILKFTFNVANTDQVQGQGWIVELHD